MSRPLAGRSGRVYVPGAWLAEGSFSEAWSVEQEPEMVVKIAKRHVPNAAERLRREAEALSVVEHPALARLLDAGEDEGRPFLVLRRMAGESLATRLETARSLAVTPGLTILAALLGALEALHAAGLTHGDLRAANVILVGRCEPVLIDLSQTATATPEAVAAEVRGSGALLHRMLAGNDPPPLQVTPARGFAPALSELVRSLIAGQLATATAARQAVEAVLAGL